jgi:hypothetical protein
MWKTTSDIQKHLAHHIGHALMDILSYFAKVFDDYETSQSFALELYAHHVVTLLDCTPILKWYMARLIGRKSL